MASELIKRMRDDLDGTADETGEVVKTRRFAVGNQEWEIDLTEENWSRFCEAVAEFVEVARKASRKERAPKASPKSNGSEFGSKVPDNGNRAIREWAAANGHQVPSMGRIPRDVVEAYDRAQRFGKAAG